MDGPGGLPARGNAQSHERNAGMKKIALVGYFGWGNFGDELFLEVHRQQLAVSYELFVAHDLLEAPYFSRPVSEVVDEADAILIGGGDLLNPLRVSELYWQMEYLRKPTFVYGLGVPNQPFRREHVLAVYQDFFARSEEHTSELQSRGHLVCRLLLETKKPP